MLINFHVLRLIELTRIVWMRSIRLFETRDPLTPAMTHFQFLRWFISVLWELFELTRIACEIINNPSIFTLFSISSNGIFDSSQIQIKIALSVRLRTICFCTPLWCCTCRLIFPIHFRICTSLREHRIVQVTYDVLSWFGASLCICTYCVSLVDTLS